MLALPASAVFLPIAVRHPLATAATLLALATIPGAPAAVAGLAAEVAVLLTPGGARSAGAPRRRRADGDDAGFVDPRRRRGGE